MPATIIESAIRPFADALSAAFADPTSVRSPDAFSKAERKAIAVHVQRTVMMFPHVAPSFAVAAVAATVKRNAGGKFDALTMRPDALDSIDAPTLAAEIEIIRTAAHDRADDAVNDKTLSAADAITAKADADKAAADAVTFVNEQWGDVLQNVIVYRAAGNGRVKTPCGKLDADIAVALALTIAGRSISGRLFARAMGYAAPKAKGK